MVDKSFFYKIKNKILNSEKINIPVLEIHIVDHCNLKCKGCSHFSNIADEFFITIEEFSESIDIAKKHLRIFSFALMGGEPLLHPEIGKLAAIARQKLPNSEIAITTNGLLLDTITDDLWGVFIENNITLNISKYPVNSDKFSHMLDVVAQRNILGRVYVKNYFRKYINLNGDSNRHLTYDQCYAKHCLIMKGKNLYKCPFSLYVKYFNKKFNTKLPISPGLNLQSSSRGEIIKFLNNPIESCCYCSFLDDNKALFEWELSSGTMEEWCVD